MIHRLIARMLPFLPKKVVWLFSRRYISGIHLEDAVKAAIDLDQNGAWATVDHLGEFITELAQVAEAREACLNALELLAREDLNVTCSLKPTSFGLLINFDFCYQAVREVVMRAGELGKMVRIDMEDATCVDRELELYRRLHAEFPKNVGIVIQSYLRRTADDLIKLASWHSDKTPVNVRLCKGIYQESEVIAYKKRDEINERYLADLTFLFSHGIYVGIATHDKFLVRGAYDLIENFGLSPDQYEFQMLFGVTPELRAEIIGHGHHMRVYVPYGRDWFGYSTRRLRENPKMVGQIIKALFIRG
ncbi:proline dehydrogenase family protein [Geofilum rubicundum]|uniref:proline dehydrogenase n=1 Tax=Geofilum rubicundum JCM 15548 TaxID=1236989 RepID=A0A0E9LS43_9BACT|nr:proline dehydrogenase family protein [Geofilum rubicundum]GAO28113.1 proline dehydrogenase [Geofilum rubicundum JCM 15548]